MKVFEFDIRLFMSASDDSRMIYVDELPASDQEKICKHLHGEYDWLYPERHSRAAWDDDDDYFERRMTFQKEFYGFGPEDVMMDAEFKNGKLHVTIISTIDFDTPVMMHKYSYSDPAIQASLFDAVKFRINGALSDGIGENPIGENIMYDFSEWSVELAELESSDPLCGMYGEENQSTFFKINI